MLHADLQSLAVIVIAVVAVLAGLAVAVLWLVQTRTGRKVVDVGRDTLIFAAHPDDCVILAGQYALACLRAGGRVRVVYLTCGGATPPTEQARTRCREAVDAWTSVGLSRTDLHFLDLPQSPVDGSLAIDADMTRQAHDRVAQILEAFPENGTIIVHADGESHVDHQLLRSVVLEAVGERAGRWRILEAPEYNSFYSIRYSPLKTLRCILGFIPILRRMVGRWNWRVPPSFPDGHGQVTMPTDDGALAQKCATLRVFASEDGELLVQYFGFPDRFRVIGPDAGRSGDVAGYVRVGSTYLSWGVLVVLGAILLTAAAASCLVGGVLASWTSGLPAWRLAALAGVVAVVTVGLVRFRRVEQRALMIAIGAGALLGIAA